MQTKYGNSEGRPMTEGLKEDLREEKLMERRPQLANYAAELRGSSLDFSEALTLMRQGYRIGRPGTVGYVRLMKNATVSAADNSGIVRSFHVPEVLILNREDGKGEILLTLDNSDIMATNYELRGR